MAKLFLTEHGRIWVPARGIKKEDLRPMSVTIKCDNSEVEFPKGDLEALMTMALRDIDYQLVDRERALRLLASEVRLLEGAADASLKATAPLRIESDIKALQRWRKLALMVADVVE